jgi:hypothetical protein
MPQYPLSNDSQSNLLAKIAVNTGDSLPVHGDGQHNLLFKIAQNTYARALADAAQVTAIASESSVKFGLTVGGEITNALPATPTAGERAKYYITLTGSSLTFSLDAAILLPSDSGMTLPKTFTSAKTYVVLFEFNGTSWMLVSLVGGY